MFNFFNKPKRIAVDIFGEKKFVSSQIQAALLYSIKHKPDEWKVIEVIGRGGRHGRSHDWRLRNDELNIAISFTGRFINPEDTTVMGWMYYYVNDNVRDIVNVIINNYKSTIDLNKKIVEEEIRYSNTSKILNHIYGQST